MPKRTYSDGTMKKALEKSKRGAASMTTGTIALPEPDHSVQHIYHRAQNGKWVFSHTVTLMHRV
jgi:hypothetical protein